LRLGTLGLWLVIGTVAGADSRAAGQPRCSVHGGTEGHCREGATRRDLRDLRRANPQLRHLTLQQASPAQIRPLARFDHLTSLTVSSTHIDSLDGVLGELVRSKSTINKLAMQGSLSVVGMRHLGRMQELEHLDIGSASLPRDATDALMGLSKLKYVRARGDAVLHLRHHPAIEQLWVTRRGVMTNAGFEAVAGMTRLTWLKVMVPQGANPAPLGRIRNLRWLDVTTRARNSAWLENLSHLLELTMRCSGRCEIPRFHKLRSLRSLTLWTSSLGDGLKPPTSLRSLRVPDYVTWDDRSLASLAHLENLRELVLRVRTLTDSATASLNRLQALQRLALWDAEKLSSAGLAQLALPRLNALDLSGARMLRRHTQTFRQRNPKVKVHGPCRITNCGRARWTNSPPVLFPSRSYGHGTQTDSPPHTFRESLGSGADRVSVNVRLASARGCRNRRADIERWVQRQRFNLLLCMSEANRRLPAWRPWGGKLGLELLFGANREVRSVGVQATTRWYSSGGLGKCLEERARRFRYREQEHCRLRLDVELYARPKH